MSDPGQCANCGHPVADTAQKFCPACGQPTPARRIDWRFLGQQLADGVFSMERGIAYSLAQLMLRPGHLMRDYIGGRRGRQAKPLLLLMVTAALVVFLSRYLLEGDVLGKALQADTIGASQPTAEGHDDAARIGSAITAIMDWMNRNFAAATLLALPLEAAAFKLAFRRFKDVNYPEWLVITTFLTVQTFVLWSLLIPLQGRISAQSWTMAASFAYGIFSLAQFFSGYPRWKSTLRTLFGFALFLLLSALFTVILVVVATQVLG